MIKLEQDPRQSYPAALVLVNSRHKLATKDRANTVRQFGKANSVSLLVGWHTSITSVEISVDVSFKKTKIELPYHSSV